LILERHRLIEEHRQALICEQAKIKPGERPLIVTIGNKAFFNFF